MLRCQMENRIKRLVAVALAFLLVISGLRIGTDTVRATDDATDLTITAVGSLGSQSSTQVRMRLVTNTTFQSTGYVQGLKDLISFEGMDSIVKEATGISGYASQNENVILLIFDGVSINDVSAVPEGAKMTFKPGTITHGDVNYYLTNSNTLRYYGGWAEYTDISITSVSPLSKHAGSGYAKLNLTTNTTFAKEGNLSGLKNLITFEGMDTIDTSGAYGYAFTTGDVWFMFDKVNYADVIIPEGAKLTFHPGAFTDASGTSYYLTNTTTLTYRNGAWAEYKDLSITAAGNLQKNGDTAVKITLVTDQVFQEQSLGDVTGLEKLITFEGMDSISKKADKIYGHAFNDANTGTGRIYLVFAGVSYSDVSAIPEGAKMTFAPGSITMKDGTAYYLTNSNSFRYYGGWAEYQDLSIQTVGGLGKQSETQVRMILSTDTIFQSTGFVSGLVNLIAFEGMGTRLEQSAKSAHVTEGEGIILLIFDGVTISDISAIPTGAMLTFKPGTMTRGDAKYYLTNDCTLIYNGKSWQSEDEDIYLEWTNVWEDANADNFADIRDVIRTKKYIERETNKVPICLEGANVIADDVDDSITINDDDLNEMRLVLIGAPQLEMAAYDGPGYHHSTTTLDTWISEDDLMDYMHCGFTYLFPEEDAWYLRYYNYEEGQIAATTYLPHSDLYRYMELAERMNIPVVVGSPDINAEIAEGDASISDDRKTNLESMMEYLSAYRMFKGITLHDEPDIQQLPGVKAVKNLLDSLVPDLFYFTSHHPMYGPAIGSLTADTTVINSNDRETAYESYVDQFSTVGGSFVYDNYPLLYQNPTNATGYALESTWFQNLEIVAASARDKQYDAGITIQSTAYKPNEQKHNRPITSKADVGFQMYTALAYGMKNVNYYTYYATEGTTGLYSAMVNFQEDGTKVKTAAYDAVRAVNWEIRKFDHVLLDFDWQGTMAVGKNLQDYGTAFYSVGEYDDARINSAVSDENAIIGCMKNSIGQNGYMVVNATDPGLNLSNNVTVEFANTTKATAYVNGNEQKITLSDGSYTFNLKAGEGVFVVLD